MTASTSTEAPYDRAIATPVHGHYWVRPAGEAGAPILMGFHGYGENAQTQLPELDKIPTGRPWHRVAVQALHPFYTRAGIVVASWMTRFDREQAIADNLEYVRRVVAAVREELPDASETLVFAGFSQGVAMAYRAAAALPASGLIALAGDVPPEVDTGELPPVLLGRGRTDKGYPEAQMDADLERLRQAGVRTETVPFDGGHEWTDAFREATGRFLDSLT